MELSSRALKWMQYVVAVLVLLTLTLLLWHRFGMERVVELSAAHPHEVSVDDDRSETDTPGVLPGNSVATLEKNEHALTMRCHLGQEFSWPYCKFRFMTGHDGKGIDLSDFDTISLDLSYAGPMPHRIKILVVNGEPGISKTPRWRSSRVHELEMEVPAHGTKTLPVNLLRPPDWWTFQAGLPVEQTYTRIDNVVKIELVAGYRELPPDIAIELRAIRFHGKWITKDRLLMALVSAWVVCGLVWMALGILHFRSSLAATNARLATVEAINKALELEARELAGQAYTDPLTGALNRQGLRDALVKRLQSTGHYSDGLSVIFVDLDFFKRINDQHGHDVGDDVLRRFAALVRAHVRAADKLVRWGGEEFLLVCPETNAEQAALLAEKLRAAMQAETWPNALAVTASFGVTEIQSGEDIGAAITRADGALYRAKAGGRNRVELA
jgi:diguanylate cyclase (GGDEF)-like protein